MKSAAGRTGAFRRVLGAAAAAAVALAALAAPAGAQALMDDGDDDPPGLHCVGEAHGSLSVSPAVVNPGQLVTLSWNVQAPVGCGALSVTVDYLSASRSGSRAVDPIATRSYGLRVAFGGAARTIATAVATVQLLTDSNGRPTVTLTANNQVPLLLQAITTPNARIFLQNHLELDLTGYQYIYVAGGVQLIGGRTSRQQGPLLYVRCILNESLYCGNAPNILFLIHGGAGADHVRFTGLRIAGPETWIAREIAPPSHGITIESALDVQIDNNEIYGWRGSAVRVSDALGRICRMTDDTCPVQNDTTVRIHNNFIHHNQQDGTDGYGVEVVNKAFALIEKNVFDYNRHAIASDGELRTGYYAHRNLVLEHGGVHEQQAGMTFYTHAFDMHGTDTCSLFSEWDCGAGGEYVEIMFNTFFYDKDNAYKLRGTPSVDTKVASNVFANPSLTTTFEGDGALGGYTQYMQIADNLVDVNENGHYGHCDFDRDGLDDEFLATGQTWWFRSGAGDARHWRFLNTSKARLADVQLGDVDGDGRCDVVADGVVSSGGTGRATKRIVDLVWKSVTGTLANWEMSGGTVVASTAVGTVAATWQLAGAADLRGDGRDDLVWRDSDGQLTLWEMAGGRQVAESRVHAPGYAYQGGGDFDADGADDLLWRDAAGRLVIWFKGHQPHTIAAAAPPDWLVRGVGDFDGAGRADILLQHPTNALWIWHMVGAELSGERRLTAPAAAIQGVADFDADGRADVLWRDRSGVLTLWPGADPDRTIAIGPGGTVVVGGDPAWSIVAVRDFNRDGRADILWQEETGRLVVWILAGGRIVREEYPRLPLRTWTLANRLAAVEEGGNGGSDEPPPPDDELPVDCFRRCV